MAGRRCPHSRSENVCIASAPQPQHRAAGSLRATSSTRPDCTSTEAEAGGATMSQAEGTAECLVCPGGGSVFAWGPQRWCDAPSQHQSSCHPV